MGQQSDEQPMIRRSHYSLEIEQGEVEPRVDNTLLAILAGVVGLAAGLILFLLLGNSSAPSGNAPSANPFQTHDASRSTLMSPPVRSKPPAPSRKSREAEPGDKNRKENDETKTAKSSTDDSRAAGHPPTARAGGLVEETPVPGTRVQETMTNSRTAPVESAEQPNDGSVSGTPQQDVVEEYPEDDEELPPQVRQPTRYVDLPPTPRSAEGISAVVLCEGLDRGPYELRLLGIGELHPSVVWDHEKDDPQRIIVHGIPENPELPREVLARFYIQQGKLHYLWSFQPNGMMRRYQEIPRECVLEVTDDRGTTLELLALTSPTQGKPERMERLLKGDKRFVLGKAIPGLKQRRIYLDTCQLSVGKKRYISVPVSIATKENREALPDKNPDDERPLTPIGDSSGPPAQRLAKKKASEQRNATSSGAARSSNSSAQWEDEPEAAVDLKVKSIARSHVRQQNFPEAALDSGMPMLFFEEFPHADHLTLRIDTRPSYVGFFNRMMGARNRLGGLDTGIQMHQKNIIKLQNAIAYWRAQPSVGELGRGAILARVNKAQEELEQEQNYISQHEARKPRWIAKEQAARAQYDEIKSALEMFSGGLLSGTFYRIVDDVRVDVLRLGSPLK